MYFYHSKNIWIKIVLMLQQYLVLKTLKLSKENGKLKYFVVCLRKIRLCVMKRIAWEPFLYLGAIRSAQRHAKWRMQVFTLKFWRPCSLFLLWWRFVLQETAWQSLVRTCKVVPYVSIYFEKTKSKLCGESMSETFEFTSTRYKQSNSIHCSEPLT